MLWIPITLAAATFQILRTSRQHQLKELLSTNAAGFVRYAYGAPLALLACWINFGLLDRPFPLIPGRFWAPIIGAGIAQIVGTVALLASFRQRDFAVGTVYSKAEVLLVALFGAVGLGSPLTGLGWVGALLVTFGVMILASKGSLRSLLSGTGDPAALLGIAAGTGFGLAAVGIGAAADSLTNAASFDRALLTLTVMLVSQTLLNLVYFVLTKPSEITAVAHVWRKAIWVGLFSLAGSIGWSWSFTLESAAKVRTLGQVELIIAFVVARVTLGERHTRQELTASAVVIVGVLVVALWG